MYAVPVRLALALLVFAAALTPAAAQTYTAIDLNPSNLSEFTTSEASAVSGSTEVGYGSSTRRSFITHALLWTGTADSTVDLNPTNLKGFITSQALAVSGSIEVGFGSGRGTSDHLHALLWTGTANSAVDLNAFLPVGYNTDSEATAVNSNGDIVGYGIGSSGIHAFLWHLNAAPPKP